MPFKYLNGKTGITFHALASNRFNFANKNPFIYSGKFLKKQICVNFTH